MFDNSGVSSKNTIYIRVDPHLLRRQIVSYRTGSRIAAAAANGRKGSLLCCSLTSGNQHHITAFQPFQNSVPADIQNIRVRISGIRYDSCLLSIQEHALYLLGLKFIGHKSAGNHFPAGINCVLLPAARKRFSLREQFQQSICRVGLSFSSHSGNHGHNRPSFFLGHLDFFTYKLSGFSGGNGGPAELLYEQFHLSTSKPRPALLQ